MQPIKFARDLYLLPLDQDIRGFTSFIGSWLYRGDATLLIDPGPASTIPLLKKMLAGMGIHRLDAILLTHIHIDHAGGAGHLTQWFKDTPVVCHSSAIVHLADPARLWEGSLKTLGPVAEVYQSIAAVPLEMMVEAETFTDYGVRSIPTPGHAPHHVSYLADGYLFAGEAGGVFCDPAGKTAYLRPATPPRFYMDVSIGSIDCLIRERFDTICYGHFGIHKNGREMLRRHRRQLVRWKTIVQRVLSSATGDTSVEGCLAVLLAEDPDLAVYAFFDPAVKDRERVFLNNSIRGFMEYLCTGTDSKRITSGFR